MSSSPAPISVLADSVSAGFASSTPRPRDVYEDESHSGFMDPDELSDGDDEEDAGSLYESMREAGNDAVDFINTSFGDGTHDVVILGDDTAALLEDSVVVNIVEDEDEEEEEEEEEKRCGDVDTSGNSSGDKYGDADENDENAAITAISSSAQAPPLRRSVDPSHPTDDTNNLSQRSEGEWRLMDSDDESEVSNNSSDSAGSPPQNKILEKPGCTRTPLKTLVEFDDGERGVRGAGGWKSIEVADAVVAATFFPNDGSAARDDDGGDATIPTATDIMTPEPSTGDAVAPPLPPMDEWKAAKTPTGKTYYYNRRTRESSWKLPEGASSSTGAILAPKSTGKKPSRPSPTTASASTAAAISTPGRNPGRSLTKTPSEMTPESVDPQQRQRNKNERSEARQRKIKSMAAVAKEEVAAVAKENATPADRNAPLEMTRRSVAATSRAESAAKSASRVLENSRAYEELDRTFTNEISFNPNSNPNTTALINTSSSQANPNNSNLRRPQTTPSSKLTPPPNLTHNASRRRLFDENAAAVPSVYCVYCGTCTPPSELNAHMNNCFVFQRTWEERKDTQKQIEGAIMTAWGLNLVGSGSSGASKSKSGLPEVKSATETCDLCTRTFKKGRLEAHRKVCLSVFGGEKKTGRTPFNKRKEALKGGAAANVVSPDPTAKSDGIRTANVPLFECTSCPDGPQFESREALLKHMRSRSCTASTSDTASKRNGGNQVCPYCGQPTIKLSNHLARCRHAKKAMAKEKEKVVAGGLPHFDEIMSATC